MSKELIVQMFHHIDSNNWAGLRPLFCRDVIYERPGYAPIIGAQELLDFYERVRVIAAGRHTIDGLLTEEDSAACWGHFAGTHRNGTPLQVRFADCYTFEDGMIKKRTSYFFTPAV
ncbi:nuclear transport factor 2 family protein [Hyalangium versicolor]|uniref:nuclear transport factor 2 family protein n=1 Tax=Hyalangium versicolor TaxID=2861190 RepID=UPI001CCE67C6|nr:nuclear transport factor 2 family protein [Hyalangium versicolor]